MKKILLIDEEGTERSRLEYILSLNGYNTILSENYEVASNKITLDSPELIVSEVGESVNKTEKFIEIVRSNSERSKIPVIFVSAKYKQLHEMKSGNLKADAYIAKPYRTVELLDVINSLLK